MGWSKPSLYSAYYRALVKVETRTPPSEAIATVKKVLVIANSGIGNLILTLPLLETLHEGLGRPTLDVVVSPRGGKAILENQPHVGEVLVYDDPKFMDRSERKELFSTLRSKGYDMVVISYVCNSLESAMMAVRSGADIRVGHRSRTRVRPDKLYNIVVDAEPGRHEVQYNLDLARGLGLDVVSEVPRLQTSKEEKAWAEGFLEEEGLSVKDFLVGFHPGSHKDMAFKRWRNFADLGKLLVKEMGARVLVMGGPDEKELCDSVVFDIGEGAVSTAGRTSLRETAALIQSCEVFVSNDSGLMHLSVAVGTPVVALFGPTDWRRISPAGKHELLRHDTGCGPCYVHPGDKIGCREIDCLNKITPEEVFKALQRLTG